ncbi:MAG: DUF1080 domain-containing protein [Verrucomicrobiae bacterium]|nr:DUF1080 domain-containing protein [Verrucomicrobiae bacterium]MCP5522079.1 DUF1080 domain-containing protein [Verrucomicrobiales bacterium]
MKTLVASLASLLCLGTAPINAADNVAPPGFVSLFNGRDLTGWKIPDGDNGHWRVLGGVIDYDARSESPGDKNLWTTRKFENFVLRIDWRIKETPYINPRIPYILPDGTHARDVTGKPIELSLPDSDSGVFIRGSGRHQINIWCWPIGSGEMYGVRMDPETSPELRAAVTPRHQADRPVGEWNSYEITVKGDTVKVVLNGITVIPGAKLTDLPAVGPLALQHHGGLSNGVWNSPPSLLQFKNIYLKELP